MAPTNRIQQICQRDISKVICTEYDLLFITPILAMLTKGLELLDVILSSKPFSSKTSQGPSPPLPHFSCYVIDFELFSNINPNCILRVPSPCSAHHFQLQLALVVYSQSLSHCATCHCPSTLVHILHIVSPPFLPGITNRPLHGALIRPWCLGVPHTMLQPTKGLIVLKL